MPRIVTGKYKTREELEKAVSEKHKAGENINAIARETGVSAVTVKKLVTEAKPVKKTPRKSTKMRTRKSAERKIVQSNNMSVEFRAGRVEGIADYFRTQGLSEDWIEGWFEGYNHIGPALSQRGGA